MNSLWVHALAICGFFATTAISPSLADEGYPLRQQFPQIKTMSSEKLNEEYGDCFIVDVRSRLEYDVIHITKALHIPVAELSFIRNLEKATGKDGSEPIVFYCNGHSCAKAYEAAELAMEWKFKKIFVYDSGIHDWVTLHPEKTTLMGISPAPAQVLIPPEKLAKRKVSLNDFRKKAKSRKAVVIDIRDPFQRRMIPRFPNLHSIPLDQLLERLGKGEFKDRELLIFDAVGRQVEWLQYYLEKFGYKNYSFLRDGVLGIK
ncbi:rhodanese-like domain-containing protein [Geotalea sp. SG265]|uniref:rhodanese-like domain-containing protein n=1 Tax=Geotalea sp. SG265 TaxID=2922867 RepID=UPI001FAF77CD|nr:rhodanese-like domain-containing protein [Geotalea sp. SG265]